MRYLGYILVYTTSSAFKSEKILKANNIIVKLVPTPRQFSSDCGIACEFISEDVARVELALDEGNVEYKIEGVREYAEK